MRHGWWLVLAAVGCGGKGGTDTGATTPSGGDDDDNGDTVQIDCSVVPQYDLESLTCEQIAAAFIQATEAASACNTNDDCLVVHPNCSDWADVGCYYVVNKCMPTSSPSVNSVQSYSTNAAGCRTSTGQVGYCECSGAPEAYCVDHHCCSPGSADGHTACVTPPT